MVEVDVLDVGDEVLMVDGIGKKLTLSWYDGQENASESP